MNVLKCTFSLFIQVKLCLLEHHTLGRRLNFTKGPKHASLTFMELLSLLAAKKLEDPELM